MASLYKRGDLYWITWVEGRGAGKKNRCKSTGVRTGELERALKVKAAFERELAASKSLNLAPPEDRTVASYLKRWVRMRREQGVGSADDDAVRLKHAAELFHMELAEVRPKHIRDVVRRLRREATLAPRTIRHVFGVLHRLFEDARVDELVLANPCTLRRGDLPGKTDADPTWRSGAVFSRQEVEALISDPRIPQARRTLYTLLFCAGTRIGEAAALRWRSYYPDTEPLGKLVVALSFSRKRKKEKAVKTERTREVPVHPTLAAALAAWKLSGWRDLMGRKPEPKDLLIPAPTGNHLRDPVVYANLQRDLATLGLRPRRVHDARRTFISLALADGARKDLLTWVTHGPPGDIVSSYTTLPWPALCGEVSRLNVRLCEGPTEVLQSPDARKKQGTS